jgi:hypothetical protein
MKSRLRAVEFTREHTMHDAIEGGKLRVES